jgi:uncharacterized protein (DUF58 family)
MTQPHPIPGARFIDPAVLQRIDDLELVAKTVVDGFINGLHRSPYLGLSLDFAEHRAYMPGDDIRRIDWRLYARTDRYHVKEFEADTNANFVVLLDVSRSMAYRGTGVAKLDYARMLAGSLAYFASRQRDRVGLVTFDEDVVDYVPPSAKHLEVMLHTLDRASPGRPGRLVPPLRKAVELLRRRGLIALISDLYEEPESVADAVRALRYAGNDVLVFHLLDPTELEFPFEDAQSFEDLESGERIPVVPAALRERYRELVQGHVTTLGRLLRSEQIDYAMFDTSQPLEHALFALLAERERLQQAGAGRRNGGPA